MNNSFGATTAENDLIFIDDVRGIFENKITYQGVLKLIWAKELPAFKLQGRWVMSRRVVEAYKAKKLGLNRLGNSS